MLDVIGTFFVGTIVQCLPALIVLVAWGEGGNRILRQFGARLMWELAIVVVAGVTFLLYIMLRVTPDEGANLFVIIAVSVCSVLAVTAMTHPTQGLPSWKRGLVTAAVALLTLQAGLALAVFLLPVTPA